MRFAQTKEYKVKFVNRKDISDIKILPVEATSKLEAEQIATDQLRKLFANGRSFKVVKVLEE